MTSVLFGDTVTHPGTVMVKGGDTALTVLAVLGPQLLILIAHRAVSGFNIQDYLVVNGFVDNPLI